MCKCKIEVLGGALLGTLVGNLVGTMALPANAETVTFGVRWTDNRGNFETQNRFDQDVRSIVVVYQRLGKTSQSYRENNLTRTVCGTLSPQEVCRFTLPWSADNQVNIIEIRGRSIPRTAVPAPPEQSEAVNPSAPRLLTLSAPGADTQGNYRITNNTKDAWSNVTVSFTRISRVGGLSMTNHSAVVCSRVQPRGVCQFQIKPNSQGESVRIDRVSVTATPVR